MESSTIRVGPDVRAGVFLGLDDEGLVALHPRVAARLGFDGGVAVGGEVGAKQGRGKESKAE